MDPYQVLGIDCNATQDEIKLAYRRVAMKWHPDRNDNSPESRERFHQAAEAYRLLYARTAREKTAESEPRASGAPRDDHAQRSGGDGEAPGDEFADSVFRDAMLDYAIRLARTGKSVDDITLDIRRNGCAERLARVIADRAFEINAQFTASPGARRQHKPDPNGPGSRQERLDAELWRAFLGQRGFVLSGRGAIEYYLVVFREFSQSASHNPFTWISLNRRLARILNFTIVLFATMLAAVHFFPGPAPYKLMADADLLQVPLLILPAMLAWMLYRKLWLVSLAFALCYLGTLAWYDAAMPRALEEDIFAVLSVAAVCFAPFVVLALFANFLYFQKSQRMLRRARQLFGNHMDQLVWIKNRAGTSAAAAFLFVLLFVSSVLHLAPLYWDFSTPAGFASTSAQIRYAETKLEETRQQVGEALDFFDLAEAYFNRSPPDYVKAEMAYSTAAHNGSLLAAYKLGYMYYAGEGVTRNDALAFDYFQQATRAPLAFQPHSLEITTRFLAESYNNLGIMYQAGLGTRRNLRRAEEMFRRAAEFGSASASDNLGSLYPAKNPGSRKPLTYPDYR